MKVDDDKIFGYNVDELKIMFLVVAVIFSVLRLLSGGVVVPFIILPLSAYLLLSERKKEHWVAFKEFVNDFRRSEEEQKRKLEEIQSDVDSLLEDEKMLEKLSKEMKSKGGEKE